MIYMAPVMLLSDGRPKGEPDWFKLEITARLYRVEETI